LGRSRTFGAYDPSSLKLAVEGVPVYPRAVTLTTPAKAMLLIALGEQAEFELQVARVPAYYGISPETAGKGFDELVRRGLAQFDFRSEKDPMHRAGKRVTKFWRLIGHYEREMPDVNVHDRRLRRVK